MRLYYETALGRLWHGDCLEGLKNINSAGMVITDPPYGVNYEGGHFHSGDVNIVRKRERLENDDTDIYERAIPAILSATSGPCYVFFSDSKTYNIYKALDKAKADIHALLIWHKTNATYAAMNAQYKQRHEPILYFKRKGGNTAWCGKSTEATILHFPRPASNEFHPTQKPVSLIMHLILNHTDNIVLDPFFGSGTTAVACERLQRRWIGIEISEEYYEIAARRIEQETRQLKLF